MTEHDDRTETDHPDQPVRWTHETADAHTLADARAAELSDADLSRAARDAGWVG